MKKKILSIVLALAMVLGLAAVMTGCGDDPVEAYNKAAANMSAADDIQMQGTMKAKIDMQGQSQEITMNLDTTIIKSTTDDPADMQAAMEFSYSMMGQSLSAKMYIKDKTVYTESNGTKTKSELTKEATDAINQLTGSDQKIDDYVKDSKSDGDDVILTLDSKKYLTDLISKLGNLSSSGDSTVDMDQIKSTLDQIDMKDITITATIKDENFTAMKVKLPIEIDMSAFTSMMTGGAASGDTSGQKMSMDIDVNMDPIKVNSGAKIDFPDFSDYK